MIIYDHEVFIIFPLVIYFITKNLYLTLFFILFFLIFMHSPNKAIFSYSQDIFYSPSSGYIREIKRDSQNTRISLFLNVLDNHTQYFPLRSKLISSTCKTGLFMPAYKEHSINNQRVINVLESEDYKFNYTITQITGILTRRIKSLSKVGNTYNSGDRLGFIVLGSRVDIVIPNSNISILYVKEGQKINEMEELIKLK